MPLILAEELDTLTVQKIEEWNQEAGDATGIFLDVIDKGNLTTERLARLQRLVNERRALSESHAVDADELNAKLRQISPRLSPTPSDAPSTPVTAGAELTWEEWIEGARCGAYATNERLKGVGGRPSREINPDPGPCPPWKSDINKRYHVPDHWNGEAGRLRREFERWLEFRWHQFKMRESPKRFDKYQKVVHKYREMKGIDWAVELQLNRQTKLDEWKEYYVYEHRKRYALEIEVDRAKNQLEQAKEGMRKAEQNGSVGVPFSVWWERRAEMIEYKEKLSKAQKEVDIAQKRLDVLKAEVSLSTSERSRLTTQAKEDLELAQKRLDAQKSGELEQLLKERERARAQETLLACEREVDYANTQLEQRDALLEWIAGQFAGIAAEYASSSWGSKYNCDLLEGWEKFYAYMQTRLEATQETQAWFRKRTRKKTEAEEAQDDLQWPLDRERPLKAFLAWVEREFPEIATQYAPSMQDRQSHDDHGDEADAPYSQPSPKASQPEVGKKTQDRGRSGRQRSPLSQVQASKVSKPVQRRRRPLKEKLGASPHVVWQSEGLADDVRHVEEQEPPMAVRRSKRISQQQLNARAKNAALQRLSGGALDGTGQPREQMQNTPVEPKRKTAASATVKSRGGRSRPTPRATSNPADGNRIRKRQRNPNGGTGKAVKA